jgi:hypothetical protein
VGSQKLSEMLQQPYDLYKPGWADGYLMGLINQVHIVESYAKEFICTKLYMLCGFFCRLPLQIQTDIMIYAPNTSDI